MDKGIVSKKPNPAVLIGGVVLVLLICGIMGYFLIDDSGEDQYMYYIDFHQSFGSLTTSGSSDLSVFKTKFKDDVKTLLDDDEVEISDITIIDNKVYKNKDGKYALNFQINNGDYLNKKVIDKIQVNTAFPTLLGNGATVKTITSFERSTSNGKCSSYTCSTGTKKDDPGLIICAGDNCVKEECCVDGTPTDVTCTRPTTTGYNFGGVTETLSAANFSATGIVCGAGYTGTATATACTASGPYTVSGCRQDTTGDVNCSGTWSPCTIACEDGAIRTWTTTTEASGTGTACPTGSGPDCGNGDGACVTNADTDTPVNCTGGLPQGVTQANYTIRGDCDDVPPGGNCKLGCNNESARYNFNCPAGNTTSGTVLDPPSGFNDDSCTAVVTTPPPPPAGGGDTTTDPCDANPCLNGGGCMASGSGYTCNCAVGFSGPTCNTQTSGGGIQQTTNNFTLQLSPQPSKVGYDTFRVKINLQGNALNVYALFGDGTTSLRVPPSFQVAAPFGADIGGVSQLLFPLNPNSVFDSWLTVGTDPPSGEIGSVGIDWTTWTETVPLIIDDGAVFWMDPDNGPHSSVGDIVIAQFTVPRILQGTSRPEFTFTGGLQGKSVSGDDWQEGFSIPIPASSPVPPPPPVMAQDVVCTEPADTTGYTVTNTTLGATGFDVGVVCATGYENTVLGIPPTATTCGAASGDYTLRGCTPTLCATNERVSSNACTPCPAGTTNVVGDDASGNDTTCDNINECDDGPCMNGGVCVDGVNAYTCTCVGGYTGPTCAAPPVTVPDDGPACHCRDGHHFGVGAGDWCVNDAYSSGSGFGASNCTSIDNETDCNGYTATDHNTPYSICEWRICNDADRAAGECFANIGESCGKQNNDNDNDNNNLKNLLNMNNTHKNLLFVLLLIVVIFLLFKDKK